MNTHKKTTRKKRSDRRKPGRSATAQRTSPYIVRKLDTYNILSEEGLCLIEENADCILKDIGMEFHDDPELLALFQNAGCDVDETRVRFDPGFCRSIISDNAPRSFIQHARNPENSVKLGDNATVLCPSWGPPFVHDLDMGRRYATYADFERLVKLHHTIPWLHHSGGVVCEPIDLPANKRHLDMLYAHMRWSDRACMGAFIGAERAGHAIDMEKSFLAVTSSPITRCFIVYPIPMHLWLWMPICRVP